LLLLLLRRHDDGPLSVEYNIQERPRTKEKANGAALIYVMFSAVYALSHCMQMVPVVLELVFQMG